jgi:anti-sigma regulatory factor (Ser/Thr protein kinase)
LENDVNVVVQDASKTVAAEIQREIYSSWYFLSGIMFFVAIAGMALICIFTRLVVKKISSPVISRQQRRDNELQVAHDIQMAMVPKKIPPFVLRKDIDVYGFLQPAKEVGGDFYDYILIDNVLYFIIGDVSGKGVPAALFMAITRSVFRACIDLPAGIGGNVEKMLFSMNNMLCRMSTAGMFVTLFAGCLDLKTGSLSYSNAGHNPPVICGSAGARFFSIPVNIPVNVYENFTFEGGKITLQKGETLFIYTDGITEAEDKNKNLFGEENLLQCLSLVEGLMPQEIADNLFSAVRKFAGKAEQNDDITMLAITYYPPLQYTLEIENKREDLVLLYDFMQKWTSCFDSALANKINLAVEEAVVNVISYAYGLSGNENGIDCVGSNGIIGAGDIEKIYIECKKNNAQFNVSIRDAGKAFNPLEAPVADIEKPLENRTAGGLGIYLLRNLADEVSYCRKDGENILVLTFNICSLNKFN